VTDGYGLALLGTLLSMALIVEMLRRRQLTEKYSVIWLGVGLGIIVLSVRPSLLAAAADVVGIEVPANLLFFVAGIVLLLVCLQLSFETSRLEDETRSLAEELALVRQELEVLRRRG
jgi:hypothetical protein